jgi:hypothetical protein
MPGTASRTRPGVSEIMTETSALLGVLVADAGGKAKLCTIPWVSDETSWLTSWSTTAGRM